MGKSNIMNLNNNTASERMGKPVRSNFLSKNGGKHMEETNVTMTAEMGISIKFLFPECPRYLARNGYISLICKLFVQFAKQFVSISK